MGGPGFATEPVETAARLVAFQRDLEAVQPHELRGHVSLQRLLIAVFDAAGIREDWIVTAPFRVPSTQEPLVVRVAVGRRSDGIRTSLIEGAQRDMTSYYGDAAMRTRLDEAEPGPLGSWELWLNAYFWNAIRDALFGTWLAARPPQGAVWRSGVMAPGAEAVRLAWLTLAHSRDFANQPTQLKLAERGLREWLPRQDRLRKQRALVLERARQLSARLPPRNIPVDLLARRNPPSGTRRKSHALTLTEQLCRILVMDYEMGALDAAAALGMSDPRQVKRALKSAERKVARWPRPAKGREAKSLS